MIQQTRNHQTKVNNIIKNVTGVRATQQPFNMPRQVITQLPSMMNSPGNSKNYSPVEQELYSRNPNPGGAAASVLQMQKQNHSAIVHQLNSTMYNPGEARKKMINHQVGHKAANSFHIQESKKAYQVGAMAGDGNVIFNTQGLKPQKMQSALNSKINSNNS